MFWEATTGHGGGRSIKAASTGLSVVGTGLDTLNWVESIVVMCTRLNN